MRGDPVRRVLRELERAAARDDRQAVRVWLKRLVPEYSGVRSGDVAILPRPRAVGAQRSA